LKRLPGNELIKERIAIYVDSYHHLFKDRRQCDSAQTECMEYMGYTVIHIGVLDDWEQIVSEYPNIFGTLKYGGK